MNENKKGEPDHSKFGYHPRDIDKYGAVKGCICEACKEKRKGSK